MSPHIERVYNERVVLLEKIAALRKFLSGKLFMTLPAADRELLSCQVLVMKMYADILDRRIALSY